MRDLPDGLHVGICGADSPFTDDKRSGPCALVVAGKRLFVVDTGSGSARVIGKMGFNQGRIGAIFLTHFHSDHIDDLGTLMLQRWVSVGNTAPVPVTTRDAGHFLREDKGVEVATAILAFIRSTDQSRAA